MSTKKEQLKEEKFQIPIVGRFIELKNHRYYVTSQLHSGPFSEVFTINDGKQQYALKTEKIFGTKRSVLKLDVLVLKTLNANGDTNGFPNFVDAGRLPTFKYIIMELIGPDLSKLRRSMPNKR
ncbi:hypothetical protein AB6A40_010979 [Gnathostoma spinigerum]|uniref:Protein kinase domain-containing protein n=1 Tax=Gnathostoma spinigerum TaxID=75299 RepID=A0ABD6F460_9BILA